VNRVEPPISPGDRGPLIADLHAALRAMIDNGYLTALAFTAERRTSSSGACLPNPRPLLMARL
jgi:hypothetical protein